MIHDDKPPLDEALKHFGVKGMRWGVRKDRSSGGGSSRVSRVRAKVASTAKSEAAYYKPKIKKELKRTAIEVGTGVAVAGGIAAAGYLMSKHGSVPLSAASTKYIHTGEGAAKLLAQHSEFKKKAADLSAEIAKANFEQDQWMRSVGLGAVVNNRK